MKRKNGKRRKRKREKEARIGSEKDGQRK